MIYIRYKVTFYILFILFALVLPNEPFAATKGTLSDNIQIKSKALDYDLQFRVYTPHGLKTGDKLPTIYVTDGQEYVKKGRMIDALDKEISTGKIKPVIAVFVDARDPDNLKNNRRKEQFFCKENYVNFFTSELIPFIDQTYHTSPFREDRVILGVSFGGFNSGCFGLMAPHFFQGVAMNSPANDKFVRFLKNAYDKSGKKDLKIFMSVGSAADNRAAVRSFRSLLKKKGYDLTYRQNHYGHDWDNWVPLLPDVLNTFFSVEK